MTRPRIPTGLYAIGWLFLLHGLANVFVGVFRVVDLHRASTDVLAGALPRAQVCLLVIWLILGTERLSWRLSGLIAGCSFIFMIYSKMLFPGELGMGLGNQWLAEEWAYYFRLTGPGDWLARLPLLIACVGMPLLILRVGRAILAVRRAGMKWTKILDQSHLQFRFQDMAIWTVTICLALAAIYQTAPYTGWLSELLHHGRQMVRFDLAGGGRYGYVVATALIQAGVALVSLWGVYSKRTPYLRLSVTMAVVMGAAYALQFQLPRAAFDLAFASSHSYIWEQASAEWATTICMAATVIVSLLLFRLYETLSRDATAA